MGRASEAQKAERLNRARLLLRQFDRLPDAVEHLARDCSLSPRQAQRLKQTVSVGEAKLAFTVKLPGSLIRRVRLYASVKRISIGEVVRRALLAGQRQTGISPVSGRRVRSAQRKKMARRSPQPLASRPNECWSMDYALQRTEAALDDPALAIFAKLHRQTGARFALQVLDKARGGPGQGRR